LVEDMGLETGNRVLLRAPNNPMLVAAWFAVLKAGGISVTTMPMLRAGELVPLIDKAQVTHALCDAALAADLDEARKSTPSLRAVMLFSADGTGEGALEQAMASKPASFDTVDTAADDVALIAFTSGTTGGPKGTIHFHRDVLAIADMYPREIIAIERDDVFAASPPLAFTFGLGALVIFPMRYGASAVLVERFGPDTMLETIARYRCTGIYTAPTAYRAMLPKVGGHDLSSLRVCVSAGEHLPKATWDAWHEATGIALVDGLGATELLHIFVSAAGVDIRPGATGKAIAGYETRLIDADGQPLPLGSEGRLAVRGPTGCRYLADPKRQKGYVLDGWNVTGDVYRQDADGYLHYVARADDMIISAGYNIAGPEVENALLTHPGVQECAVVGVADEARGQVVKAFVVPTSGTVVDAALVKSLQDHVKATIAPYKYPRAIAFVEALPKTQTGKVQRFRLRDD
ncbi:MAG: AMP-binding protein, partial [Alphaproteobacteria bacterium]|nr:AMP-binding protein [Alphaproteobacteria bacterium]